MPEIRPLSAALAKKAAVELNETPERIDGDLEAIREWLKKMPHIKARTDDQFLVAFLRGCKYSLEKVKEKLDMYYTVRTAIPELIANRDPLDPKTLEIIKLGTFVPLPKTNGDDGPRIMLMRMRLFNPKQFKIEELFRVNMMMMDISLMEDDSYIIAGQIGILDVADCGIEHFTHMTPSLAKKSTMLFQDASPLRLKGNHYLNTPSIFETLMNMFKQFLNEKNRSRLYVHSNVEKMYPYVPQDLLPTEYGGKIGPIQDIVDHWVRKLVEYREFFAEENNYGTIEKLRLGKPKSAETLFGTDGTFRKLNVD